MGGGKLVKAIQRFYMSSRAYVGMGGRVSYCCPVNVAVRQGCVMSSWLLNLSMDGVAMEEKGRTLGRGIELVNE